MIIKMKFNKNFLFFHILVAASQPASG
jgi:hypothetical protein